MACMVAAKVTFMRGMNPVPSERLSAAWGPTGARLREKSAGEAGRLVQWVRRAQTLDSMRFSVQESPSPRSHRGRSCQWVTSRKNWNGPNQKQIAQPHF
ncbi:uncharacterized protein SCHCODRAFT_01324406 [Schizophyllum commune H4-8]|uniref:uncharacterized protein n=1 Tax=Schizophyllum commune (strain H4-8 / FGSC 9210) TaxID=578458 RepID=UPI00215E2A00|nr:uncharacterized protein SCHCODRAFT_01324406 [Schizophyllum commune H4-8]KAI5889301.1 hypothetical protein SCHCODRAFT_01324406 [Schizophyllum commune H4-8]